MPFQQGNLIGTQILWQTSRNRIRTGAHWPLTIDIGDATSDAPGDTTSDVTPLLECAPVKDPPAGERWMPAPAPEPVSAFVQASVALAAVRALRLPRFAAGWAPISVLEKASYAPSPCDTWMPAPAPEPVTAFVQASAALAPARALRLPRFAAGLAPISDLEKASNAPRSCDTWMPAPAPEPVTAFVQASTVATLAYALRLPRLAAGLAAAPVLDLSVDAPPACDNWMPPAAPESVAAFLQASAAPITAYALRAPRFAAGSAPTLVPDRALYAPAACNNWMPAPAPEPVAAFVQASAAPTPAYALRLPRLGATLAPVLDLALDTLPACNNWMPAPAPEPVAAFVQASAALTPAYTLRLPRFDPELEPAPLLDKALLAPLQVPAPVAVFSRSSAAPAPADTPHTLREAAELETPALQASAFALSVGMGLRPAKLHEKGGAGAFACQLLIPACGWQAEAPAPHRRHTQLQSVPYAEPVIGAVRPGAAKAPPVLIPQEAAIALPAIPQVAQETFAAESLAGATPAPEAVERLLVTTQAAVPVSIERAAYPSVALAAPRAVFEAAPAMGKPVAGLAPAAVESLLVASVAAPVATAAAVRLLPFAMAGSQARTVPLFDAQRVAPKARKPDAAAARLVAQPIATLAVAPPALARPPLESALPRPGLRPTEFHSHRLRSAPVARPEWIRTRPALLPPQFLLHPVLEKLAEPAPLQKIARVEVLNMPAAKRLPTVLIFAGRIAAGFLLATSLWFGVASFRRGGHQTAHEEVTSGDVALVPAKSASSARVSRGGAPAPPAAKGPVAWVGRAVANRAALKVAENFHGMENWGNAAQAYPAGWSRHPDGYVNTGALALFRPSIRFADYRMEFFGQIEARSIAWTVRATDARNYHAMKVTVVEAGLRPFVALVQYNVVNGKSGHRTQTPLNVMVHNNKPMQFAVDVRGNRFVTSINGEEVDSFIDNTLVAGGVGFFSEAGEHSRLYWMRFSRNDDWLGRVCAMLAEGAGVGTVAGLRRPELPGGQPAPGLPGDRGEMTLAALWIGLPYLGTTRKTRFFKNWSKPWNT